MVYDSLGVYGYNINITVSMHSFLIHSSAQSAPRINGSANFHVLCSSNEAFYTVYTPLVDRILHESSFSGRNSPEILMFDPLQASQYTFE